MNKVIIFSSARSGGNLLDYNFNQYKGVQSFGEFFARRYYNKRDDTIFNRDDTFTMSNEKAVRLLEERYRSKYNTLVFRYHGAHFKCSYNDSIYDDIIDYKKVLLYRENFLNKMVSLTIASTKEKWHYIDDNNTPNYDEYDIYYSSKKLDILFNVLKNFYNNMLSMYGDMCIVKYEDLVDMDNIDSIMSKLEIDANRISNEVPTHHINKKDDGYKNIVNLEELNEYQLVLKKTKDGYRFT